MEKAKQPRKRKINPQVTATKQKPQTVHESTIRSILLKVQENEIFHNKYIKEMKQLYARMKHEEFIVLFVKLIKAGMVLEDPNEFANNLLLFCAKFVSSYDDEETHPVLISTFKWLLTTISDKSQVRYRICQFVNMILNSLGMEAALDDAICDHILRYMLESVKDLNPNVRVQAIQALQRLQVPDNPDDVVVKAYLFHLSSDPSPRVRQAIITLIGKNYNTVPYILERLWDIDEKVRRHTYIHMSAYPVKAYKVAQRLIFLEQGLNDRSEMVRKVLSTVLLPQWLESYNGNFIEFISALKLDANETEIDRFRKISKATLSELFKKQKMVRLIENLPIEEEGEFKRCIPISSLTMENSLYWLCLTEFFQENKCDEFDLILPELSVFCAYIFKYCESCRGLVDKWARLEHQYILLTLMEIICNYDLGDEVGRDKLKILLNDLLRNFDTDEKIIEKIARCAENLFIEQNQRLQFFIDIIKDISDYRNEQSSIFDHDRTVIAEILERHSDKSLKIKVSTLKVKIMDLEQQEMEFVEKKDYVHAQKIAEEKNICIDEYANLIRPLIDDRSTSSDNKSEESTKLLRLSLPSGKKITTENIVKCLQIAYHMIVSKKVTSLTPNVCELYKEFIRRHIESNQIMIRDWALQCGTAYSLLYDQIAKDVYIELYRQFYKNHNIRIWRTSIQCIFELIDRYGVNHFELEDKQHKNRKPVRQLYNTSEFVDMEDDSSSTSGYGVDLMFMMSHFLDTCDDVCILKALIHGFCRLILHDRLRNDDIIEKLLLKYFNPTIDPEINQLLGVFFENLIVKKKQQCLETCLLPTIKSILIASYDNPLHEIKPETVLRFVIDATRPIHCNSETHIHCEMAKNFLEEMQKSLSNKDLLRILSKELTTLEIQSGSSAVVKENLKELNNNLLKSEIDAKVAKNLLFFNDMIEGKRNIAARVPDDEDTDEADKSDDENQNQDKENIDNNKVIEKTHDAENMGNDVNAKNQEEENDLVNSSLICSENNKNDIEASTNTASETEEITQSPREIEERYDQQQLKKPKVSSTKEENTLNGKKLLSKPKRGPTKSLSPANSVITPKQRKQNKRNAQTEKATGSRTRLTAGETKDDSNSTKNDQSNKKNNPKRKTKEIPDEETNSSVNRVSPVDNISPNSCNISILVNSSSSVVQIVQRSSYESPNRDSQRTPLLSGSGINLRNKSKTELTKEKKVSAEGRSSTGCRKKLMLSPKRQLSELSDENVLSLPARKRIRRNSPIENNDAKNVKKKTATDIEAGSRKNKIDEKENTSSPVGRINNTRNRASSKKSENEETQKSHEKEDMSEEKKNKNKESNEAKEMNKKSNKAAEKEKTTETPKTPLKRTPRTPRRKPSQQTDRSKTAVIRLRRLSAGSMSTRSATKKQYEFNNIMTRTRKSLTLATSPSKLFNPLTPRRKNIDTEK